MRISIVGTGYVGLVSGACLADIGHDVICVDIDESKIERINRGEAPIYEEGLADMLSRVVGTRLRVGRHLRRDLGRPLLLGDPPRGIASRCPPLGP